MNTQKSCDVLNDVTKTLIDSQRGYAKAYDMADDNYALRSEFQARAVEREKLVNEFQDRVRSLGGEPQTDGGAAGAMHRSWASFTSMFSNDEKAALSAIDDGEEYLAERIEDKIEDEEIEAQSRMLLRKAYASAKAGERWADRLEDQIS